MSPYRHINNSCKGSHSGVGRVSHGMRDVRGGFCEVQQVNCMPLLLSYNHFVCSQVDTLIQPEVCNTKVKKSYKPSPIPSFLTDAVAFQPGSISYLANMLSPLAQS
jgi:hypothetical protein